MTFYLYKEKIEAMFTSNPIHRQHIEDEEACFELASKELMAQEFAEELESMTDEEYAEYLDSEREYENALINKVAEGAII